MSTECWLTACLLCMTLWSPDQHYTLPNDEWQVMILVLCHMRRGRKPCLSADLCSINIINRPPSSLRLSRCGSAAAEWDCAERGDLVSVLLSEHLYYLSEALHCLCELNKVILNSLFKSETQTLLKFARGKFIKAVLISKEIFVFSCLWLIWCTSLLSCKFDVPKDMSRASQAFRSEGWLFFFVSCSLSFC